MANLKVTLIRLCKTPHGWRRYPAVITKNGKVKPGYALVHGQAVDFPEGRYQLRSYEGARMVYKDVGLNAALALNQQKNQTNVLRGKDALRQAGYKVPIEEKKGSVSLDAAMDRFIGATEDRGSVAMARQYRYALPEFLLCCRKTYKDEVSTDDVLGYVRMLRNRGLADQTINTRFNLVKYFFLGMGCTDKEIKGLFGRAPRVEKSLPEIYNEGELAAFFQSLKDERLRVAYEILWKCGLREQELTHLEWSRVDLVRGVLRVRANPRTGFKVKDGEARDVTIPDDLLEHLRAYRERAPGAGLVVASAKGGPATALCVTLKRLARRAGLTCGACEGCLSARHLCEAWWLHKFRATYITMLLRSGMDLKTVMKLSGHSSLSAINRYIAPAGDDSVRAQVNAVKWL